MVSKCNCLFSTIHVRIEVDRIDYGQLLQQTQQLKGHIHSVEVVLLGTCAIFVNQEQKKDLDHIMWNS